MISEVLYGGILEEQFDDEGRLVYTRYICRGETYKIEAKTLHRVTPELPLTITLIRELEDTGTPGVLFR